MIVADIALNGGQQGHMPSACKCQTHLCQLQSTRGFGRKGGGGMGALCGFGKRGKQAAL